MSDKFEACVMAVKAKQKAKCASSNYKGKGCYNPWAICNKSVGSKESPNKKSPTKKGRKVHTGPRGGKYHLIKGKKVYLK